jgi:hypothetical protein
VWVGGGERDAVRSVVAAVRRSEASVVVGDDASASCGRGLAGARPAALYLPDGQIPGMAPGACRPAQAYRKPAAVHAWRAAFPPFGCLRGASPRPLLTGPPLHRARLAYSTRRHAYSTRPRSLVSAGRAIRGRPCLARAIMSLATRGRATGGSVLARRGRGRRGASLRGGDALVPLVSILLRHLRQSSLRMLVFLQYRRAYRGCLNTRTRSISIQQCRQSQRRKIAETQKGQRLLTSRLPAKCLPRATDTVHQKSNAITDE